MTGVQYLAGRSPDTPGIVIVYRNRNRKHTRVLDGEKGSPFLKT